MSKIILPIKPKYSQGILNGIKDYELRKKAPKQNVNYIYIYETAPSSRIVGKVKVKKTHKLELRELWKLTSSKNLLSKPEFYEYFKNVKFGYAFEIEERERFDQPKHKEEFGLSAAPQGFAYVR